MTRREIVAFAACIVVIGWLATDALANGGDTCTGSISMAGVLRCTSNNCAGTCANTGWNGASGGTDQWKWDPLTKKWVFEKTLLPEEAQVQGCACDGITHTCCRTVKIKDGAGFKYGTYGGCIDDCDPPMHDPCHPSGNPTTGDVQAECRP